MKVALVALVFFPNMVLALMSYLGRTLLIDNGDGRIDGFIAWSVRARYPIG